MNKIFIAIAILVSSIFADIIHLRNGQEVKDATITEVGDSDVKYKIGQRATIYTAKKTDIESIVYDDGTKDIFDSEPARSNAKQEAKEKNIRFGTRVSGGIAGLTGEWGDLVERDYVYGGGAFSIIPFDFVKLNVGASIMFKLLSGSYTECGGYYGDCRSELVDIGELALEIPALFRFSPTEGLYIEVGPQINLAVIKEIGFGSGFGNSDSNLEFGITAGIGFNITEHISSDIRIFYGVNDFDETLKGNLYEVILGVNYLF